MGCDRVLLLLLLSLLGVVVQWQWSAGGLSERLIEYLSIRTSSSSGLKDFAKSSLDWSTANVQSSSLFDAPTQDSNKSQIRYLRRTENKMVEDEDRGGAKQTQPATYTPNQMFNNPMQQKFREGINKGLFKVAKFLMAWFAFMFTLGGVMRCYLCCETMWTTPNCTIRGLCDSFADRERGPDFENESEGIVLDTLRSRDNDDD